MINMVDSEVLKLLSRKTAEFWDVVYATKEERRLEELLVWGTQIVSVLELWEEANREKECCESNECKCTSQENLSLTSEG